jgi:hypothetical protein
MVLATHIVMVDHRRPKKIAVGQTSGQLAGRAMARLLLSVLQLALATAMASAQNEMSQEVLALTPDERNAAFARLLEASSEKCDRVTRTLFVGTAVGLDQWEALCKDRNSYSISITPGLLPGIEVASCRELLATSQMLLHRAGSKSKATGCRIR